MVLTQSPPNRPLRADARRNREAIVTAADDLFRTEGLALQMDEVAQRAGLGVGTVYRHFPTKEALTAELVQHRLETVITRAESAMETDASAAAIRAFIHSMARMMGEDLGLRETFQVQSTADAKREECAYYNCELHDRKYALVRKAQAAGIVRSDLAVEDFDALMCGMGQSILAGGNPELMADVLLVGMRVPAGDTAGCAAGADEGVGAGASADRAAAAADVAAALL
ncbi:TetR/AcrR family transcriptional regulator [Catenulispora yoronensis]|uniref:TetR/AcrR family transcriptional regulator n=1 Tax=Catenulispora yoronensis TaxID=450799 RepID=A0ABP5GR58_9ACTN